MLLGTLAALAAILYFAARRELIHHHDAELVRAAHGIEKIVCEHEDCAQLTADQKSRLDAIGGLVLVHDVAGEGQVFYRSEASGRFELPPGILQGADVSRRQPWFDTVPVGDSLVRLYSAPYTSRAGRAGLIRIMEPLGDVEEPLETLRNLLLLLAPIALMVAFGGGMWLAGRALRPVSHVTTLAREIEAHDLSRRLPAPASRDEMGRLIETINQMLSRLESSFSGMTRFTADASHELRTPLASIVSTIDVVLAQPRSQEEHVAALRSIAEDVQGLRVIVDDLLVLARADAGAARMRSEPLRLDDVVRETAESLLASAAEANVSVVVGILDPIEMQGDELWLRQLASNLVENAVKFATRPDRHGRVDVELRQREGEAVLRVSDDGPGIAEGDLPRIFDRFYRGDSARAPGAGVGLGLAIASWVAQAHRGRLEATNRATGGAVLMLVLPVNRA